MTSFGVGPEFDYEIWLPTDEDYDTLDAWLESFVGLPSPQELSDFVEALGGYIYPEDTIWN